MSKFARSAMGGLLFAAWLMCFVFPISLIMAFSDHTPIADFLIQQVFDFLGIWFICGVIAHSVIGMFDDINRPRQDNHDNNSGDRTDPDDRRQLPGSSRIDGGSSTDDDQSKPKK